MCCIRVWYSGRFNCTPFIRLIHSWKTCVLAKSRNHRAPDQVAFLRSSPNPNCAGKGRVFPGRSFPAYTRAGAGSSFEGGPPTNPPGRTGTKTKAIQEGSVVCCWFPAGRFPSALARAWQSPSEYPGVPSRKYPNPASLWFPWATMAWSMLLCRALPC